MRCGYSSSLIKKPESENYSVENRFSVGLAEYMFIPYQGIWSGPLKGYPDFRAYAESFEELQRKLHQLHPDLNDAISSSVCSNAALLCWDWKRRISRIP